MKVFKRVLLLAVSLVIYSSTSLACGGANLTNEDILGSQELLAVTAKINEIYGREVTTSEILRTGNKILNIDKVEVMSAMCAANYHHVYMESKSPEELRCLVVFEPGYPGQIKVEYGEIRAACSLNGGKQALVKVPFKKNF